MVLQPCHSSLLPQCIGLNWNFDIERRLRLLSRIYNLRQFDGLRVVEAGLRQLMIFQSLTWPAQLP